MRSSALHTPVRVAEYGLIPSGAHRRRGACGVSYEIMTPRPIRRLLVTALLAALTGPLARPLSAQTAPDSSVYVVVPGSRLVVKTGKSGLFGFAGHAHVIRARSVTGALVYRPGRPTSSLHLRVPTESLQVLTPPDTAEIRKVTEAMRTEVLHPDRFPTMTFAADSLDARRGSMHFQLAVTMEGTTRPVPVAADVA